jgi:hypothetical protein
MSSTPPEIETRESLAVDEHAWVRHTIAPVVVMPSPEDGTPCIFIDPSLELESEKDEVYGCAKCDLSVEEGFGKPCHPSLEG